VAIENHLIDWWGQSCPWRMLMWDGKDCRLERLTDRKQELRRILSRASADSHLCYVAYIDGSGIKLFRQACRRDLEGIVAKQKHAPCVSDREETTWFKVSNLRCPQWEGREERFEREKQFRAGIRAT
jgi:ATP-dependent DNA ligase